MSCIFNVVNHQQYGGQDVGYSLSVVLGIWRLISNVAKPHLPLFITQINNLGTVQLINIAVRCQSTNLSLSEEIIGVKTFRNLTPQVHQLFRISTTFGNKSRKPSRHHSCSLPLVSDSLSLDNNIFQAFRSITDCFAPWLYVRSKAFQQPPDQDSGSVAFATPLACFGFVTWIFPPTLA